MIKHVSKEDLEKNEATAVDLFSLSGKPLVLGVSSSAAAETTATTEEVKEESPSIEEGLFF